MNLRLTRREFLLSKVFKNAGPFQPIVWLAVILLLTGLPADAWPGAFA